MADMPIYGKNPSKIFFSGTRWTDFNETWHEASMTQVLQCVYKSWPCDGMTYFMARSSLETLAFTWEQVKTMDFFENYCSLKPEKW